MSSVAHDVEPVRLPGPLADATFAASVQQRTTTRTHNSPVITPGDRAKRAAEWATRHGMAVFPLASNAKRPGVPDWEHAATRDPEVVASRWPSWATGYGVACGPSGLYVVDCDTAKADTPAPPADLGDAESGLDALLLLAAEHGQAMLSGTFTVRTGRGGFHLYYREPRGLELRNTAGSLAWLVDTRGHGGYVVGPGSTVDGHTYEVTENVAPAELPAWIVRLLGERRTAASQGGATAAAAPSPVRLTGSSVGPEWAAAALAGEAERIRTAPVDKGNDTVNRAAYTIGRLVGARLLSRDVAERDLTAAFDTWTWSAPGDRERMVRTLRSGLEAGERNPRTVAPREQRRRAA